MVRRRLEGGSKIKEGDQKNAELTGIEAREGKNNIPPVTLPFWVTFLMTGVLTSENGSKGGTFSRYFRKPDLMAMYNPSGSDSESVASGLPVRG